ncbi:MAG: hypothetical protein NZ838_03090, partial [Candidatus Marinimicrobia bacterium]|nr:hypothetical protein [Candidatus Neomarinimicrobiota bacterium]
MKKIVIILSSIIVIAAQQKHSVDIMPGMLYERFNDAYTNVKSEKSAENSSYNSISSHVTVSTFAGSGEDGSADGTGTAASFNGPSDFARDGSGNLFVADLRNDLIRKITPAGVVTTFAGSGTGGSADGTGTAASFDGPSGLAMDGSGNLFVVDYYNDLIRKITPSGVVTTFAGSGTAGSADGTGTAASFSYPWGIAIDNNDNLFIADYYNNLIRKITPSGVVTTFAGSGTAGSVDGTGTAAYLSGPTGLSFDSNGNLFVAEFGGNKIRKITPSGVVTTFAGRGSAGSVDGTGTDASFDYPIGITIDNNDNMYIADAYNYKIRKITSAGIVTTLAGSGTSGSADGAAATATFKLPYGLEMSENNVIIYVADFADHIIRKIVLSATPVIASISDVTIKEDETATVTLSATDAESDPITFSVKNNNVAGNFLNFDGVDDWVQTKNASGEEDHPIPDEGDFTVSVWARRNASASGLMNIYSQGKQPYNIYLGSGESGYIRAGDSWGNTGVAFPIDGMWHHYVITKSSSNTYLYLDGELAATKGSAIDNPNPEGSGLYIGKQYG